MASPSTAIQRFDLSLSYGEFSLAANRKGFIGLRVLTPVGVALQNSNFLRIKVESVLGPIEDTKRAPKATYKRGDFEWFTDNFTTEDHGVLEDVDDRTIAMYGNELRAEQIHTARGVNRVLQAFENEAAAAVFDTAVWNGGDLTTTVGTPWSTAASAVPINDIDAAIEKVKTSSGMRPNTLILTDFALRKLKRTAQIQDLLKYSGRDDPKNLGAISGLKELFDLERILVADGFKNASDEGQDPSFSRLWDITMAMVCHVNASDDLEDPEPTIGRTVMWTEENGPIPGVGEGEMNVIIEEYREEPRRGGAIRVRADYQQKILQPEAGHLLTGVTA